MNIIENLFRVLGGGNTIGTSCYYLQVDDCSFLLDCGANIYREPHLPAIGDITTYYLDGLWQLDKIIISHAHFDHMGALPYLITGDYELDILCNPITKILIELQLNELNRWEENFRSMRQRHQYEIQKDRCLTMLQALAFKQTYKTKNYAITLFPAGHIPGAAMVYIETKRHKILYTGDFSKQQDLLCSSYNLPPDLPVDILIVEGTHAYGSKYMHNQQGYSNIANEALRILPYSTITIETSNITKGIELARYLEHYAQINHMGSFNIYLDEAMFSIVDTFERANFQVYSKQIKPFTDSCKLNNAIIIKCRGKGRCWGTVLNGDMFTLHASFYELVQLINTVKATTTLIVHATPNSNDSIISQIDIGNKLCLQTVDNQEYVFT